MDKDDFKGYLAFGKDRYKFWKGWMERYTKELDKSNEKEDKNEEI